MAAQRVKVFNSGLAVYLHDEAAEAAIKASGADLTAVDAKDPALLALAREGVLVCYHLFQDDELDVEVRVGPPLSEAELAAAGCWHPVQRAPLALPSGRLRIDSADTLGLGEEPPTDPGAVVTVPPGEYVLSLHRVHYEQLKADGIDDYSGAQELLVLTPAGQAERPAVEQAALIWAPGAVVLRGREAFKIQGRKFQGVLLDPYTLNFDSEAALKLGLRFGDSLLVRVGKAKLGAVFLGPLARSQYLNRYAREALPEGWIGAEWRSIQGAHTRMLGFDQKLGKAGRTVSVEVLPDPTEPYDATWVDRWRFADGVLECEALTPTVDDAGYRCFLNVNEVALQALDVAAGATLELRVGEHACPARLLESLPALNEEANRVSREAKEKAGISLTTVWQYLDRPKSELTAHVNSAFQRAGLGVPPVGAQLVQHWYEGFQVLELSPLAGGMLGGIPFPFPIERGARVHLSKAAPGL